MARRVFLVVLIVVVGALTWLQTRQTEVLIEEGTLTVSSQLFPDVRVENIRELAVDNLQRAVDVRLQRDDNGVWQMIDPLEARASIPLVQYLLDELERGSGRLAPDLSLEDAGLSPPQAVVSFSELRDGSTHVGRIEIGAIDIEGRYVYVRIPDHPDGRRSDGSALLLASRTWETLLTHDRDAYRDPLLMGAHTGGLQRIRRVGRLAQAGGSEPRELALALERDGQGGWRLTSPVRMQADDTVAAVFLRALLGLKAHRFLANDARGKEHFGLKQPLLSFELSWLDGSRELIQFGTRSAGTTVPKENSEWVASLEGSEVVSLLPRGAVGPLLLPLEVLYDQQFVRALRSEIAEIQLTTGAEHLLLKASLGVWSVVDSRTDEEFVASPTRVEELLAVLERVQLTSFPQGATLHSAASSAITRRQIRVRTHGGAEFLGELGGPLHDETNGVSGLAFQRADDALVGLTDYSLVPWFKLELDSFRQRVLWDIQEGAAEEVLFERGDHELAFLHQGSRWVARGASRESNVTPPAFLGLLDHVLRLKAVEWVSLDSPLTDAVRVVLRVRGEEPRAVLVGRDELGRATGQIPGGASFELKAVWLDSLDALLP